MAIWSSGLGSPGFSCILLVSLSSPYVHDARSHEPRIFFYFINVFWNKRVAREVTFLFKTEFKTVGFVETLVRVYQTKRFYSRITSTKAPSFCVTTSSAILTHLTVFLPRSHDYSCYVSRPILAPPPLGMQKHVDLRAHDFSHSPTCDISLDWLTLPAAERTRGADKSVARPGRKQARKHVRDARDFNNIETRFFFF